LRSDLTTALVAPFPCNNFHLLRPLRLLLAATFTYISGSQGQKFVAVESRSGGWWGSRCPRPAWHYPIPRLPSDRERPNPMCSTRAPDLPLYGRHHYPRGPSDISPSSRFGTLGIEMIAACVSCFARLTTADQLPLREFLLADSWAVKSPSSSSCHIYEIWCPSNRAV